MLTTPSNDASGIGKPSKDVSEISACGEMRKSRAGTRPNFEHLFLHISKQFRTPLDETRRLHCAHPMVVDRSDEPGHAAPNRFRP